MRPRLERDLRDFSDLAKQQVGREELEKEAAPDEEQPSADLSPLAGAIDWHLAEAAKHQDTEIGVQQELFDIQKQKQAVMERLKDRLACLDDPECPEAADPQARRAEYDATRGVFSCPDDNGEMRQATYGDILTDGEWGLTYALDRKTVPRLMAKRYHLETAKRELRSLLDRQIIKSEVGGTTAGERVKEAYLRTEQETASGEVDRKTGFMAEKMVRGLLKKISLDTDGPYAIEEADIYQDVTQKIDFIVHRKERDRGVKVEAGDQTEDIGIQFTINPEARFKKMRQIERARQFMKRDRVVDDIALVVMPMRNIRELHDAWVAKGRPPGGPDKMMDSRQKNAVFSSLVSNILPPEKIAETWAAYQEKTGR